MILLPTNSSRTRASGKPRHRAVLLKAYRSWLQHVAEMSKAGAGFGKAYGSYNREMPHVMADLAKLSEPE